MEIIFNIFHVEYNTSTRNIDVYGCVKYAIKLIGVEWEISYLKKQSMLYDLQYAPVWILEYLRLKIETLQQSKQDEKT